MSAQRHFSDVRERLKDFFPAPTSDPVMDGYFVHTISQFLDRVDRLKGKAPLLAHGDYEAFIKAAPKTFPEDMTSVEQLTERLADYCQGMMIWAHPNCQSQVVPPPTIPSITAVLASALYNPNLIQDEYSFRFADAETQAIRMVSHLIGFDASRSGGIFTFGGTGTILYGCKLALERLLKGRGMREGIREEFKIIASHSAHYARLNVAAWLGLGTDNLITLPATRNNELSLTALEESLRGAFDHGERVAAIIATVGTTDAFGLDDVAAITALRDRLVDEYGLAYRPHVHADAVIGWAWSVFRDYDFDENPLGFHARTLRSLRDSVKLVVGLNQADSIGVDFHKTGYAPYISSLFLVKEREHLRLLSRQPDQMPYLYQHGRYHPGYFTLECSRSGGSALSALANMLLLGKQGYRVMIGHVVEMAEMLRQALEPWSFIKVLNDRNYGPVTVFRVYPGDTDADAAHARELHDPQFRAQTARHNAYNRQLSEMIYQRAMQGQGVLLSWTAGYQHPDYPGGEPLAALKSFIMSPWTDRKAIDAVVGQILELRAELEKRDPNGPSSRSPGKRAA